MAEPGLDIIFTAPHPDDLEIGMGGTIAKLVKLGYRVGMIHMTNGEPTPRGTPAIREKEREKAAAVLGVQVCDMLDLPNRVLFDSAEARYAVATAIRRYRPKILVGMAGRTVAASPDHYQAQLITEAARFYSQLTKWDDRFCGTEPFRVDHLVYRPMVSASEMMLFPSRFVVDITETIDQKIEAIRCYESQFDEKRVAGVEHYVRSSNGVDGVSIGVKYGEQYAMPRPVGTNDMVKLLGEWKIPPPFSQTPRPG